MKLKDFKEDASTILAIVVTSVSLVAITVPTLNKLSSHSALVSSIIGALVAFSAGLASNYLTAGLRRLGRVKRVFISYSRNEREMARRISASLQEAGLKVWLDEDQLAPGANLVPAVDGALNDADYVVAILSGSPSPFATHEIQEARASGKIVIPVLSNAIEIPDIIADLQHVDLTDYQRGISHLIKAIH
jgi:hypothetical protein